jgi:hypothetical protein
MHPKEILLVTIFLLISVLPLQRSTNEQEEAMEQMRNCILASAWMLGFASILITLLTFILIINWTPADLWLFGCMAVSMLIMS